MNPQIHGLSYTHNKDICIFESFCSHMNILGMGVAKEGMYPSRVDTILQGNPMLNLFHPKVPLSTASFIFSRLLDCDFGTFLLLFVS